MIGYIQNKKKEYIRFRTAGMAMENIPKGICVKTIDDKCYINDIEDSVLISGITYDNYNKGDLVLVIYYGVAKIVEKGYRISEGDYVSCSNDGSIKPTTTLRNGIGIAKEHDNSFVNVNLLIGGAV